MERCVAVFGWFGQDGLRINTNPNLIIPELYRTNGGHYLFSGMFLLVPVTASEQILKGTLTDRCGTAEVTGKLQGDHDGVELSFTKRYTHRSDEIKYKLRLLREPGEHFKGEYKGVSVGTGEAYLMINTIPDSFFF